MGYYKLLNLIKNNENFNYVDNCVDLDILVDRGQIEAISHDYNFPPQYKITKAGEEYLELEDFIITMDELSIL